MTIRCERIVLSLLDILYHIAFSALIVFIMVKKTACQIPYSSIAFITISNSFWIISAIRSLITIHPENFKGSDASRQKFIRYQYDKIFYNISYVIRFVMIIIGSILVHNKFCHKILGVSIILEVLLYLYANVIIIAVLEPLYHGKACAYLFNNINPIGEKQTLIQA